METTMKRTPELRDLSVEHHHGLVAARRLRQAAAGLTPLGKAIAGFLEAWRVELGPHFRAEEEILLPAFAQAVAVDDTRIVRTLTEHVALRRVVRDLERAEGEQQKILARTIGLALEDHIRFEERVLFPAIEAALEGPRLAELAHELQLYSSREERSLDGRETSDAYEE
jgi:hemerythrin-like domain-containing protein